MVAFLVVGCGGGSVNPVPEPPPRPPSDAELIDAALQRRADGIERRVRGLGVSGARFITEDVEVTGSQARVQARLTYRVRGVTGRFGSPRVFEMLRTDDRWRVARVHGSRDREPWEIGDITRSDSPHFVAWVLRGAMTPTRTLATGYDRLRATLADLPLKRRYLVVVTPDGDALRAITRQITGLESLSAVTDTQVSITGPAERIDAVRSQRLLINAAAFADIDAAGQEQAIAHELTHAVLAPQTSTRTPGWLVEGVALYASGDDRRSTYFSLLTVPTLAGLSAPDSIAMLTGDGQAAAYATASAAAYYIIDIYGEDALLELLAVFNRRDLRGERGDPNLTDKAMRRVLGIGLDEFQERLG